MPPSDPIIMDEHGQHLYDIIGPYDEGSNLTFICEVDGGTFINRDLFFTLEAQF